MKSIKRSFTMLLAMLVLAASSTGCARTTVAENDGYSEKSQISTSNNLSPTSDGAKETQNDTDTDTEESSADITQEDTATTPALTIKPETTTKSTATSPTTTKPATTKPTATTPTTTKPSTTKPPATTQPTTAPPAAVSFELDGLLGKSGTQIRGQFGSPVTTQKSEYGFTWHIYHARYADFIMIGIRSDKVVGVYSNSAKLRVKNLSVGATKSAVRNAFRSEYTGPLESVTKGGTRYMLPSRTERDVFSNGKDFVTVFYDNEKGGTLTAVQIIDHTTELNYTDAANDQSFISSSENIGFYLINSIRVRFNKPVLTNDSNMVSLARAHSQDMIDLSFFGHTNPDGKSPGDRVKAAGYEYQKCAENISRNFLPSIVSAHENLMNSTAHRKNILGETKNVGIGIRMGVYNGNLSMFQTQLFITYK